MKSNPNAAQTQIDRPATAEEIRAAIALHSVSAEQYADEEAWEIAADLGGYIRVPPFEVEASRLIEELLGQDDSLPN